MTDIGNQLLDEGDHPSHLVEDMNQFLVHFLYCEGVVILHFLIGLNLNKQKANRRLDV